MRRFLVPAALLVAAVAAQEPPPGLDEHDLEGVRTDVFATAQHCSPCHSNHPSAGGLRDAQGRGIAPYDLWRGSMMANAARDPLFVAAVAAEVAVAPARKAEIEAKCLRCHAPMAHEELARADETIAMSVLADDSKLGALARDGVSCAACHQIQPEGLGTKETWGGKFTIDEDRVIFGPHEKPHGLSMIRLVEYFPEHGPHVADSALCATCHTLFVDAVADDGAPAGYAVPEQTPYLEWRNSDFAREKRSCQSCHVPTATANGTPIKTRIAREPGGSDFAEIEPRAPVGRHLFAGGNTLIPQMLRDHRAELKVTAPDEALAATIAAATEQLTEHSARLRIGDVVPRHGFSVEIENLTGHKFPTAHPSRRAWLHVRLRAGDDGPVLFESGAFDARGRILGPNGTPLAMERAGGPVLPHQKQIEAPEQVAVYEGVLGGPGGGPSFRALRATGFYKDNRLLPRGWSPDHPDAEDTRPEGVRKDPDFRGGGDTVFYRFDVPSDLNRYSIEVELLYQVLSPRWAAELFAIDAPEIARFRRYYEAADARPVVVARARLTVVP